MMNLSFLRIVSISFHLFVSQTLAKRLNEKDNNHIRDIREASAGDTTAKVDARRSDESDSTSGPWTKPWTKIVGGVPATAGLYPWFALATYSSTFGYTWGGCGGTLITPEYVLSAAHCFASEDASQNAGDGFEVGTLCQNDFSNCDQSYEHSSIDQIYLHPGYDPETSQNDIALIKLQTKVTGIEPAKIDLGTVANDYEISKRNLWAIGFGDQDPDLDSVQVPDQLHHVELSYVDQLQCQNQYNVFNDIIETYYPDFPDLMISDDMICASDPGQDSCQGDSGGPLYDMDNDVLVGIVSWGVGCGEPILGASVPGVYSKVSHFTQWIQSTICEDGGHSDPQPELCMTTTLPPTPAPTSSPVTSFPKNIIPVSYDNWYGPKKFPAPSEYGVIEYNPVGHDYEGIAMRLTKDNRVTGSHLWVDMMLPINPALTKKPRAISFQFKMKDLRPNGMYCSMFLKRVGAPSSQASHLEIKFDKNVFRMYSSALQRDTFKGPISSVKADTWIDLVVEFDWEDCKIHIPAPFDVTDDMGSTGGACDYDGVEAVLLRGYSFDPNTEYLQAWRKIELLSDLMPEDPAPAPAPTSSDFNLAPTSITSSSRSSGKQHHIPNISILAFSAALSLMIL